MLYKVTASLFIDLIKNRSAELIYRSLIYNKLQSAKCQKQVLQSDKEMY